MLFTGWEVRIVKNCDQGLESSIFKPEVTVFHDTDRPKAGKQLIYFFLTVRELNFVTQ